MYTRMQLNNLYVIVKEEVKKLVKRKTLKRKKNLFSCIRVRVAWMTTSWEGKSQWPGAVLGKIRSLWSNSQGSTNDGLNQLIDASNKLPGRNTF